MLCLGGGGGGTCCGRTPAMVVRRATGVFRVPFKALFYDNIM